MNVTAAASRPAAARAPGRVVFVGAGPGAIDLLTLRAVECLRRADVIVHDRLVPSHMLDALRTTAERVPVPRDPGDADPGETCGRLLARLAADGRIVARLKGGDPTVFARLVEELEVVRAAGIAVEFVPGVTAAVAAACAAGVPLTSRADASSLTIVTGHEADAKAEACDLGALAALPGTLAVYMGVEQAARWSQALVAAGRRGDTPVTVVSRCSLPDQRIVHCTLADCAHAAARQGWRAPAVAIVGAAARPAVGPLTGRVVLVTRPEGQADELATLVREAGGACIHLPLVRIEPPDSWAHLDAAIDRADTYDWIVFASVNGVRSFVQRLRAAGRDGRSLGTARLAAIGPATRQALEAEGFVADLVPATFSSEGLAAAFADVPAGGRFLLVRADRGRDVLSRDLAARGHHVDEVAAYRSVATEVLDPDTLADLDQAGIDWITVTSSAIATAAVRTLGDRLRRWRIASISPITTASLTRAGYPVAAEAAEGSAASLVAAILGHEASAAAAAPSAGSPQPAH